MSVTHFMSDGPLTYFSPVNEMTGLPVITQVSADEYLSYAKADLAQEGAQGSINALGNAKRALHLMIDTLLQNYGMLAQNSRARFPDKLALLDEVGLISLNVFRRLNVERNLTEHEYTVPMREQVEDFVDVCHLLRLAMERLGQSIPWRAVAGIRESREHVLLVLEPAHGRLDMYNLVNAKTEVMEVFGGRTEYVSTKLERGKRHPMGDVCVEPSHSLPLSLASRGSWTPLLRQFVDVQPSQVGRVTKVQDGVVTVWSNWSAPFEDFAESGLAELLLGGS